MWLIKWFMVPAVWLLKSYTLDVAQSWCLVVTRGGTSVIVILRVFSNYFRAVFACFCGIMLNYIVFKLFVTFLVYFFENSWAFLWNLCRSSLRNYLMNSHCTLTICWCWLMISKCTFCGFRLFWDWFSCSWSSLVENDSSLIYFEWILLANESPWWFLFAIMKLWWIFV